MNRWTVAAGRQIYFDGKPFVSVDKEGDTEPVEADGTVIFMVECLNQAGVTPDDIWARHMGHPRRRPKHAREQPDDDEQYSMSFGEMPPFNKFVVDIRRPDPEHDGDPYWAQGTLYPMELVTKSEIKLAKKFGRLTPFATDRPGYAYGFRGDERTIYDFVIFLYEDGSEDAWGLASSIMYTLGYEWI